MSTVTPRHRSSAVLNAFCILPPPAQAEYAKQFKTMPSAFVRALLCFLSLSIAAVSSRGTPQHLFFRVMIASQYTTLVSGRLLLFLSKGTGATQVDASEGPPNGTYIAAKEVESIAPGTSVDVDTDDLAFPNGFSTLPPGDYQAQAVLDVNHSYAYSGRGPGDLISPVVALRNFMPGTSKPPEFLLDSTVPEREPADPSASDAKQPAKRTYRVEEFVSPVLSRFWGRPISMRAVVLLPPGYASHTNEHYPAVYYTHGFGGNLNDLQQVAAQIDARMQRKQMPEMVWILMDQSSPTGTHEFADSVNNGPWGQALTTEFIPRMESLYRVERRAAARFLNGHSSGGWATLWLQVNYPAVFGGTWSTSPDPANFHDFSGVDLYAMPTNMYRTPDGKPRPVIRMNGEVAGTWEALAHMEALLGAYGGQIASFEWVFSPRGRDGRPERLFDRATGDVDPKVAKAWTKFDISRVVAERWRTQARNLRGKIHIYVGTQDTFYLDGPVRKFQTVLDSLHADARVTFLEGRSHFDVYRIDSDPRGLLDVIAKEMYQSWLVNRPELAVAR